MNELEVRLIRQAIEERVEELIKERDCPKCRKFTTMVKAGYTSTEEEEYGDDVWRCMLCLGTFTETLKEVTS